jgi:hypothetical protein
MGLDDLQRRDARIAQLEAIGCRNRTRELETYARQIGLPLPESVPHG